MVSHLATERRQPRRTARARRLDYREDSSDDSEVEVEVATGSRVSRRTQRQSTTQNYRETSSTASSSNEDLTSDTLPVNQGNNSRPNLVSIPKLRKSSTRTQSRSEGHKRRVHAPVSSFGRYKRHKTSAPGFPRKAAAISSSALGLYDSWPIRAGGRIPAWQTLEYSVLVKILQYAAYPLYTTALRPASSVEWLVGVSVLCKDFREAAITALMYSPPLVPSYWAHGILGLLAQDQSLLTTNYCNKVHALDIEVKHLLIRKSGIDLNALLRRTPLLHHLRIFHAHDDMIGKAVWANPAYSRDKWSYGDLFESLDDNGISLRSFEWNGRFQDTLPSMLSAHARPCMQRLRSITITNLRFDEKQESNRLTVRDQVLAALGMLSDLQSLEFRNVNILDATAAQLLPTNLSRLQVFTCQSLTSDDLEAYLRRGGTTLKVLDLVGNQVMDLGFMPELAHHCPDLEHLHIDLTYEDSSSYKDRDPLYDDLLPNGAPSWPTKLRSIIVGPLRCLPVSDAEDFYISLISKSADMRFLRFLSIKTLLKDASWRDRAQLRSRWDAIFWKVFKAKPESVSRKLSVEQLRSKKSGADKRKSVRIQQLEERSSNNSDDEAETIPGTERVPLPRQNRCEVVEFELSDQRPAQEQFREADFLDDELSGDEEWNGRDTRPGGSGYAW